MVNISKQKIITVGVLEKRIVRNLIIREYINEDIIESHYKGSLYSAKKFATKNRKKEDSTITIYDLVEVDTKKVKRTLAESFSVKHEWLNHVHVDLFDYEED